LPLSSPRGAIHAQKPNRDPADRSQRDDFSIANSIVVRPMINSGIKQRRKLLRFRVYRGDVAPFEPVADDAAKSEIPGYGLAAVLQRDNMINFVLCQCEALRNEAVFAEAGCPSSHEFAKGGTNIRHRY
jgi:hypothetical protein